MSALPRGLLDSSLHRIPTLWSLYRPLVRATRTAPLERDERQALYAYVRDGFKRSVNLGNLERVKRSWLEAERLLGQIEASHSSALHLDRTRELARFLVARRGLPAHPPVPPTANCRRVRPRPGETESIPRPSVLHATQFAPPMLRRRPQPLGTTMMIFNRRRQSQRRYDQLAVGKEYVQLMRDEKHFDARLGLRPEDVGAKWGGEWREWIAQARDKEKREQRRNNLRIPEELQTQANQLNRRREKQRQSKQRPQESTQERTTRALGSGEKA